MRENGGLITKKDLKNYRPIWREALHGNFNEYKIVTMGPPSSGGVPYYSDAKYSRKF